MITAKTTPEQNNALVREALARRGVGNTRYLLGDFDGAADGLREALSLARRSGARDIEASTLMVTR